MMRNHCPLLHMQRDISWLLLSIFPLSQPCPVLQGVAHKIETGGKKQRQFNRKALTLLPCVAEQYRGDTSGTAVSEVRG